VGVRAHGEEQTQVKNDLSTQHDAMPEQKPLEYMNKIIPLAYKEGCYGYGAHNPTLLIDGF
jgi:hypothetical protein